MDFVIVNGEIVRKQELESTPDYIEDPFILNQKFWFGYGGIPLFYENLRKLTEWFYTLEIEIPSLLQNEHELFRITKRMLNKNKFYRSGIVSFDMIIGKNDLHTVISSSANTEFDFPLSKSGLLLNFSEFEKYSGNPLNQYAFYNLPLWKFISARNKYTSFHNSVISNESSKVCECAGANIFMVKGNTLLTPHVETGCYTDSIRNHILGIASDVGLKTEESKNIKKEDLLKMSEIFLASEEYGIQWVLGLEKKRFVHRFSSKIHEQINLHFKGLSKH